MTINTMTVTPGQASKCLEEAWHAQEKFGLMQSHMLHGEPGVGKSQIVIALAKKLGAKLYDVRLTTKDIADLRGLPYYNHENKTTEWFRPSDMPHGDEQPSILFLDELTAAPVHMHPTIYGLLQERRIGEAFLPDNCLVIGAGNGTGDGAVAYEMGTALANRLTHMMVVQTPEGWIKDFAIPNKMRPDIIAYIKTRPDNLHTIQRSLKDGDLISTTGRSWQMANDILNFYTDQRAKEIALSGRLGDAIAGDFWTLQKEYQEMGRVIDMIAQPREHRRTMYPTSLYGLNAMVYGLMGTINRENFETCIEILLDLLNLAKYRTEDEFKIHPIGELATHGMEGVMENALRDGYSDLFANSPAYKEYKAIRDAQGLTQRLD